jgi:MFS family permease
VKDWFDSTFASLEVPHFRILWFGTFFSFIAFFMSMIVQSVVAFELSGTNTAVGSVVAAQGAAMASFGSIGGAVADRWPKRRLIVICQILTALVLTSVGLLLAADRLRLEMLVVGAFIMGMSFAFMGPARQSLVADLVPEARLGNAMAVTMIANTASRVLGPVVAGLLLSAPGFGSKGAYFTMAALYTISAASMALIPKSIVRPAAADISVFSSVIEGFVYVWGNTHLRLLVVFFAAVIFVGFPHVTVLPGLLENVHRINSAMVSRLFLASAAGALISSVLVARFADSPRALMIYTLMAACFGLSLVGLAFADDMELATWAMLFVGFGSGGFQALNNAVIARETEPAYMGRVMSLTMLAFAGFGLMALPVGALADRFGEQNALTVLGVVVMLTTWGMGSALSRRLR